MKKNIFAVILAIAMVFTMAMPVFAAETDTHGAALVLNVGNGKGTVVVDVYLQGGEGITNGNITITYDASVLTLAQVQVSEAYAMSSVNDETAGAVTLAWVGSELTAEETLMLTLTLEVAENVTQDLVYAAVSEGCFSNTEALEVAGDTVTVSFDAPVDTSALQQAIEEAQALNAEEYTDESFTAVEEALAAGLAVLADADATQEEVNAAAKALRDAMAQLVAKSTGADTSELEKAIAKAEALDEAKYTEESFQSVENALAKAKEVLADEDATQAEVDAATKALKDAMAGLKKTDDPADTGDNSNIVLWIGILVLSLAAVAVAVIAMVRSGKGKQVCRMLSILLVSAMILTLLPLQSLAIVNGEETEATKGNTSYLEDLLKQNGIDLVPSENNKIAGSIKEVLDQQLNLKLEQNMATSANVYEPTDMVRILVELDGKSLLEQGYTTNQIAEFGTQVAADSLRMEVVQNHVTAEIEKIAAAADLGAVEVKYNYTVAMNGLAMSVPYGILSQIRQLDGVARAHIATSYNAPESEPISSPNMYATGESFGSVQTWNELGYTGEGMLVAVLDTGIDPDHPSFVDAPAGASLQLSDIEAVLTELNAYSLFSQSSAVKLTADDLYYSEKIPYGFNYVDRGLDISHDYDQQGDHGSHVAGTAAANKIDSTPVVGVAPDAQIIVMKLFGQNGGAFTDDILAAIEDCILLGVDVVNMSLGAPAGFTEDSYLVQEVFGRILETDMLLAVAGGNSASSAYGNALGTNLNYTSDPDNGLINSPSTYLGSTTVASVENSHVMMNYFNLGDTRIPFVDVNFTFFSLEGVQEYVLVPNYGRAADYEGLDVFGKIAVVSRGGGDDVTFMVKQENAYNAGAIGLIVYDNVEGNYISMYDGGFLPNIFISKADGAKLIENAVDGVGTIEVLPITAETGVPSINANLMSDFSCWGVTPDLQLMPDVTAPGGNIYSCTNDGTYGTMSGTSMACPHIAGMSVLVLEYLHETYPDLTDAEYHTIVESLVMCTAEPVLDADGIHYSPRKQGSGIANVYSAATSPVYLTSLQKATGELTPKASMGDDPQRTGEFAFSFDMHNLTDAEAAYLLEGILLTDQYVEIDGKEYMGETGRYLTGDVTFEILDAQQYLQYDFNSDGRTDMDDVQFMLDVCSGLIPADADMAMDINGDAAFNTMDAQALYLMLLDGFQPQMHVVVPANGSVTVNVTIRLSEEDMAYMDAHYENGIYVDGFIRAWAEAEEGVDLSLPFMGFYGGWNEAPVFDTGWYYEDEDTVEYNRYMHVLFATLGGGTNYAGLGMNPYLAEDPYSPEHNVLSPNGDTYYDYIPDIYISMMRSAEILDFTWTDDLTGDELFYEYYAYARKSYYWSAYGMSMPIVYGDGGLQPYTFYDDNGNLMVEDLQHLTLTIRAYLDDGELDNVEVNENGVPLPDHAWADDVMQIPVVIDLKAPTMDLDTLRYFTEDGRNYVTFQIEDNYDVAAVVTTTVGGGAYDYIHVDNKVEGVDGETATVTLDITDYDSTFQIVLCDYGCNETYYELSNVGSTGLNEDTFYAFRRYSTVESSGTIYATDVYNGWQSFYSADKMLSHTSQSASGEPTVYAAEYVDGYIFGAQNSANGYNTLFVMREGTWDRQSFGSDRAMNQTVYEWPGRTDYTYFPLKMIALDMAYDYTTDTMYVLANALENATYFPEGEVNILLEMDLQTGQIKILGKIFAEDDEAFLALTLACDNEGNLYTINYEDGKLYTINKTPVETTPQYGYGTYEASCISTGDTQYWPAAYSQSMTVDHATNTLYWAGYQGQIGQAAFIEMDKTNGSIIGLTYTENNGEMCGLFKPWDSGRDIIPDAELSGIALRDESLYLNVGQATSLFAIPQPFNATLGEITWSSADESIATINEYGMVVATGKGATTITATCGEFTAQCQVNISDVSGTMFAYSEGYWLLMNAGRPGEANQVADAMEVDGTVKTAAYRDGFLYVAAVTESYDADYNTVYTTNLYKLNASNLQGELLGTIDGNITALAFNYADGYMYGLEKAEGLDADWNWSISFNLIRVNTRTAETMVVTTLDEIYPCSDLYGSYTTCSGALAIDYEGNFYVNGDNENGAYNLVRFNLDENDQIVNIAEFENFEEYSYNGDAMVWSQLNNGLLYINGNILRWVDVSDMENVKTIDLGAIRGAGSNVFALVIPVTSEPEVGTSVPTSITLQDSYTVPEGETIKVVPTLNPWNAVGQFTFSIANESIAKVDKNGVITGLAIGQTTLTVTEVTSGITATSTIVVTENPGYLYGYIQALISQQIPVEAWTRLPISNVSDISLMHDYVYDLTIYAAAYYDGLVYAVGHHALGGYYAITVSPSNFSYNVVREVDMVVRAMAFDYTTGTMYAIANTEMYASALYQVDLDTMEMTLISDNDLGATLVAMTCDDEGQLYVADDYGEIYTMDKDDAELWSTGLSGNTSPYLQSMTYDYNNDLIYWAVGGNMYSIDTEQMKIGSIGYTDSVVSGLFSVPKQKVHVPETVDPAGVVLNEKNTLAVGETLAIEAVVLPVSVSTVDQTLIWTSSDETIATVDENGVITGVNAGQVYITATDAMGNSDTILITVTAEHRYFYGYDELSNAWVRFDTDGKILETWADAEDLSPIASAQYIDGVLYAYDVDGYFYTIDTETFQRTLMGNGINGLTTSLEAWDNSHDGQVYYVDGVPYRMIDMTYGTVTGRWGDTVTTMYGVMMAFHVSDWRDSFSYKFVELDMETGEIVTVILDDALVDGMSLRPTNLLYRNGYLWTINGYVTGMITRIDPFFGDAVGTAICPEYWGDFNGGRSLIEDPLTGEVYAIRDMRTEYIGTPGYTGAYSASVLCTISLSVGSVDEVCTVGTNMRITGLFIK